MSLKLVLLVALVACVFSQDLVAATAPNPAASKTFPNPDPSWTEYQVKSCCPRGFFEVLNYCVRCVAPNVFDPVVQKCQPCPQDFLYNNATGRCEFMKCDPPRQINPATNKCECKIVNGTQMIYRSETNECVCPDNLPLWNGKFCVACPPGTEYDPKEHQCYHCPEGFKRDYTAHSCVPGLWLWFI